jgi:asparagine synthase (glutamine-hydrolysing)
MKPVDPARLQAMGDVIAHRGPDGEGIWTAPGVGLGHRRLSIIDLAGSPQPMASTDGSAMLVFNGEIYNYRELRRELQALGAQFHTDGDSEVILAAWQHWGSTASRGSTACSPSRSTTCARVPCCWRATGSVKPLHMATLADGSVIFGSELKQLMAHPMLRRTLDPLAVEDYLAWGFVPDHRSIFAGVEKLGAGHYRLLRHDAPPPPPVRWWQVSFAERDTASERDLEAHLLHRLRKAVTSRMAADVPLGAFLSGGVDSSTVVALMAEASADPVKTCAIGFDVAGLDETGWAAQVARRYGTDHHARTVSSDDFQLIDRLVGLFDEPFADASALPTLRVCELAREHVTVALSGDGADEAFAGYRRQVFHHREEQVRALVPSPCAGPCSARSGASIPRPTGRRAPAGQGHVPRARAGWRPRLCARPRSHRARGARAPLFARFSGTARRLSRRTAPARPDARGPGPQRPRPRPICRPHVHLARRHPDQGRPHEHGRQPRSARALLDHRLVEFATRLPESMRVHGATGKWLMKQTMRRYLPDDVLFRPKMGFVTPIAAWLRGPLASRPAPWPAAARSPARAGSRQATWLPWPNPTSQAAPTTAVSCGNC